MELKPNKFPKVIKAMKNCWLRVRSGATNKLTLYGWMNSERAWCKNIKSSKNKCSGCFEKRLISPIIFTKQQQNSHNINHQVASYKLLLKKTPLGWYLIKKRRKTSLQNILTNSNAYNYNHFGILAFLADKLVSKLFSANQHGISSSLLQ